MNTDKYGKLFKDIILFAIGSFGSRILLFLLIPLYTNALSNSEYGIADLVFTIGDLILPLVSVTIYNGLLRFGLIDGKRQDTIRCATVVFFLGSVSTFMLIPAISLYRPIYAWRWFLAFKVVASFAQNNALICLKIKDKNRIYAVASILQALLLVGFNILFLVFLKIGISGYLLSSIISCGITAIFAFVAGNIYQDIKQSNKNLLLLREMIVFSIPFIANDISWWLIHSSDKIMIEWLIGSGSLGIYTAASKIPSLINVVTAVFVQAWGIASVKEYDSSNDKNFYTEIFRFFCICMMGVCIGAIGITKPFMAIYVGNDFSSAWRHVPLLLLSATFAAISSFVGSLFSAVKKSGKLMSTTLVAAVVNVVINLVFIPICGVWGAVIGTVVAYFVVALSRLLMLKKHIRFSYSYDILIPLCILATVEAILVGLDIYTLPVSISCITIYLFIVRKDLKIMISKVQCILEGMKKS